ncbi:hypothetical protein [Nostoc sp. KVJ20]|uniref:hypothetical protein n=1 Tax=Nostoc sp. KVJ20 TaxID=457944 RepID=UPI00159F01FD|nr:hypothetical protein [Nostoc sp. KVJ20]
MKNPVNQFWILDFGLTVSFPGYGLGILHWFHPLEASHNPEETPQSKISNLKLVVRMQT